MSAANLVEAALDLIQRGELVEAERLLRRAVEAEPSNNPAWNNLAALLAHRGAEQEAIAAMSRAVALDDGDAAGHVNLAMLLVRVGRVQEAAAHASRAIEIEPDHARAHVLLGEALLAAGELARGFAEYEWRLRCEGFPLPTGIDRAPRWTGREKISGKTLLLLAEQGFGDTIFFARYAGALARQHGARVVVECPATLVRVIQRADGVTEAVERGAGDYVVPMASLPFVLGTTRETIPVKAPYIAVETKRSAGTLKRVGVCWSGGPYPGHRAMPRELLWGLAGVDVVSLQWGQGLAAADFLDTAEVIAGLDLVISVDTAVAHLAGAMGKPVWTLLAWYADWRWMLGRSDTPWYPTMRLFRQKRAGDWAGVMDEVVEALRGFV